MVKSHKVGKRRSFAVGLLLFLVTFGIYGLYWSYQAPSEVFRQFDLDDEGRDEGVAFLLLGLVIPFLIFVYFWKAVDNVRYVRDRLGFSQSLSPTRFLSFVLAPILGVFVLLLGMDLAASALVPDLSATANPTADQIRALRGLFALAMLGLLVALILIAYAYARLQRDINEIWGAYDRRLRELTSPVSQALPGSPGWPASPAVLSPAAVAAVGAPPAFPAGGIHADLHEPTTHGPAPYRAPDRAPDGAAPVAGTVAGAVAGTVAGDASVEPTRATGTRAPVDAAVLAAHPSPAAAEAVAAPATDATHAAVDAATGAATPDPAPNGPTQDPSQGPRPKKSGAEEGQDEGFSVNGD
ncbi:MAG: DUF4234 domain-containing protein [Thermoplasmatota archaeon]